ncbi:MAG TPA: acetyl-CoA hydrolase/transferase C-terminal domain-containing protein [Methylomirabilota bacterium]|jgi:acyl-CoA hydrolase|nr:acetyl-CoA hydrolase/transferase C-terminal domain-containing protein [Methylomirabilota bacterium]
MPRAFARTTVAGAVERLRPGMKVFVPPGCGEPTALVAEICRQADRLRDLTLLGGIHLGDAPYARPERAALRAATWQMSPRLEDARRRGRVEFVPVRYFDVVTEFARGGHWAPDCVLVHTAPPDARGYLSLGVAVGVALPAARTAPLVIAQVNPNMPRTRGNCWLHRGEIDAWVDVDEPLLEYPPPVVGDVERAIGRRVADLVPDGATVQVGIGAIPQAVLEALGGHRDLALHSLLVDAAVGLVERGVVTGARKRLHRGRMDVAEAMGTGVLFDFLRDNDRVNMESSAFVHDPAVVAQLDRFVSINSALEIDLTGQVTAESLGARQVAGIGGQFDFVLGASRSRGGASVIALPSTGRDGAVSRIAARLGHGAAVTTPRFLADWVVTEHGAVRLKGRGERERAAALIAVAHPRFREELERAATSS